MKTNIKTDVEQKIWKLILRQMLSRGTVVLMDFPKSKKVKNLKTIINTDVEQG